MLVAPVSPLAGTLACAVGRPGNASPNRAQRGLSAVMRAAGVPRLGGPGGSPPAGRGSGDPCAGMVRGIAALM